MVDKPKREEAKRANAYNQIKLMIKKQDLKKRLWHSFLLPNAQDKESRINNDRSVRMTC